MMKIVPHLWYDKEAIEAVSFYVSLFENSKIISTVVLENTPSGDADAISFELAGQRFEAINGGPFFRINPSISLMVNCYSKEEVEEKWKALSEGGMELMPLGKYEFNEYYSWIQDRFGLSWQLMLMEETEALQKITPNLLFSNKVCGKAEEAVNFYNDIFMDSSIGMMSRYKDGEVANPKAKYNYLAFNLSGMNFVAMDNGYDADFDFYEAISFIIYCKDQEEMDYFMDKLSAVPEAEQCGWLKDKFGISWQTGSEEINEMLMTKDKEKKRRVIESFLEMKRLNLEELRRVFG